MPKFRVVPSILTNGTAQVKGSVFNNWRTVGSVVQAIKVHGERDVDEIFLLDVSATILKVLHKLVVLVVEVVDIRPIAQVLELFLADYGDVLRIGVGQALSSYIVVHCG